MIDLFETAVEAVKARYRGSHHYGEFLRELECAGCSSSEIQRLLEQARAAVPHPETPRALRMLRSSAKAGRRGDVQRKERLYAAACKLIGQDEVFVLIEENRLSFMPQPTYDTAPRRVRCGFAG
jgi:hypothetical protein